jgi:general secretion pathway protein J
MGRIREIQRSGFTLLEILVAMFILAIVLTTIFGTFSETLKNINHAESQADIYQMARVALKIMNEDLEGSLISSTRIFSGQDEEIDGRDADFLSFFSTNHVSFEEPGKGSGNAGISFYVLEKEEEQEEEEKGLILYRSDILEREQVSEDKTGGAVLCEGLHSVNFMYYNSDGDEYDSWDSSDGQYMGKLPSMVTIRLEFLDKSNPEAPLRFETGTAPPMAQ